MYKKLHNVSSQVYLYDVVNYSHKMLKIRKRRQLHHNRCTRKHPKIDPGVKALPEVYPAAMTLLKTQSPHTHSGPQKAENLFFSVTTNNNRFTALCPGLPM